MGALAARLARSAAIAAGAVLASEAAHWRASRRYFPPPAPPCGPSALIVLGYPARRDGKLHPVQKWRTELATLAAWRLGAERVVFSGAPAPGRPAEAVVMAEYAEQLGLGATSLATETKATTTKENVAFSRPLVDGYLRLAIVSDPLHAARARRYIWEQSPELASRLVSAGEYRFLDHFWLKMFSAGYELYLTLVGKR